MFSDAMMMGINELEEKEKEQKSGIPKVGV